MDSSTNTPCGKIVLRQFAIAWKSKSVLHVHTFEMEPFREEQMKSEFNVSDPNEKWMRQLALNPINWCESAAIANTI